MDLDKLLREIGTTNKVKKKGEEYYKQSRIYVKNIMDNPENIQERIINGGALGSGGEQYSPKLVISDTFEILQYSCNCMAYKRYDGPCKHVVGLMYVVEKAAKMTKEEKDKEKQEIKRMEEEYGFEYPKEIDELSYGFDPMEELKDIIEEKKYENQEKNKKREPINIEYCIKISNSGYWEKKVVKVRIGIKKLRFISEISELLDCFQNKCIFYMGKSIEIDFSEYYIKEEDLKKLNLINNLLEISNELLEYSRKNLILTERIFDIFIESYNGTIYIESQKVEVLKEEDIVIDLLRINNEKVEIKDFNLDGSRLNLLFYDNKIIKLKEENKRTYIYLKGLLENKINIKDNKKILPLIEKLGEVGGLKPIHILKGKQTNISISGNEKEINVRLEKKMISEKDGKLYMSKSNGIDKELLKNKNLSIDEKILIEEFEYMDNFIKEEDDIPELIKIMKSLDEKLEEVNINYGKDIKNIEVQEGKLVGEILKKGEKLELSLGLEGLSENDILNLNKAYEKNRNSIKLENGKYLLLDYGLKELRRELSEKNIDLSEKKQEISLYDGMQLALENPKIKSDLLEKLLNFKIKNQRVPKIEATLRNYQTSGYNYLNNLYNNDFGGILADDMGLGKTIQAITFLTKLYGEKQRKIKKPSIIIVPTSLLHNWKKEIEKFSPTLEVIVLEGGKSKRKELLNQNLENKIVITTYGTLKNDLDSYEKIEFEIAIIDEAQAIKNNTTSISKGVKKIKAKTRFALTGTPIENKVEELWSIFDFIIPNYLGNAKKFKKDYGNPIKKGNAEKLNKLKTIVRPFILRRLKSEVLTELPEKIETNINVELSKEEKKHYITYLDKYRGKFDELLEEKGFNKGRIEILALLTRLRQLCLSPKLILEDYKGKSSKVDALIELLLEVKESNHRVLIFSQFTKIFELLEERLGEANLSYFKIDGKVKSKDRLEMCERFNNKEKDVFLISLKAGGSGLNLTGADIVVHFDPWWNPAVENQATDRAHRMGQKKSVQVIKLIAEDTIEESVLEIQNRKKKLINSLVDGEEKLENLEFEDIKRLFEKK